MRGQRGDGARVGQVAAATRSNRGGLSGEAAKLWSAEQPAPASPPQQPAAAARRRAHLMRPLLRCLARPMKEEWKMRPYLGVLPLVFSALSVQI